MRRSMFPALVLVLLCVGIVPAMAGPDYPADFPDALPKHEQCSMGQLMQFENNVSAMLECGETPPDELYTFYLDKAKGLGWKVIMENKAPDFALFMAEKDEAAIQVQVVSDNGVTQLGLTHVLSH